MEQVAIDKILCYPASCRVYFFRRARAIRSQDGLPTATLALRREFRSKCCGAPDQPVPKEDKGSYSCMLDHNRLQLMLVVVVFLPLKPPQQPPPPPPPPLPKLLLLLLLPPLLLLLPLAAAVATLLALMRC